MAIARAEYSNPPRFGASIVETVLGDPALRSQWEADLDTMSSRKYSARAIAISSPRAPCTERCAGTTRCNAPTRSPYSPKFFENDCATHMPRPACVSALSRSPRISGCRSRIWSVERSYSSSSTARTRVSQVATSTGMPGLFVTSHPLILGQVHSCGVMRARLQNDDVVRLGAIQGS
jgi:hypothetical protein